MIIGVEGNVHSGKTTYIREFVRNNPNYVVVPECKFDETLSDYDRQLFYLEQELEKRKLYTQDNLIMDRTVLSTLCYTAFCNELTSVERKSLLNVIYNGLIDNNYILCDKIMYLSCGWDIVKDNHKELKIEKHTQDVLVENSYLNFYNDTFEKWFEGVTILDKTELGNNRIITAYDGGQVYANVLAWLKERM